MVSTKSILITGCSEGGLGDALAQAFHNHGDFRVFASARNPKKMAHFSDLGIETVTLDVKSKESINAAVQEISSLTGGVLNMLVNNSGIPYMMPIVDTDLDRVREMFDVNVISNISIIQSFLPLLLKAAPESMIVNHTSIASVLSFPAQGIYSAVKAAMAAVNNSLRIEMEPFEIKVIELKSGSVKSRFFENQVAQGSDDGFVRLPPSSIYDCARGPIEEVLNGKLGKEGAMDADVWAKQIVADLTRPKPPATIWRGAHAWMAWFASTFLPSASLDRVAAQRTGMSTVAENVKIQKKQI